MLNLIIFLACVDIGMAIAVYCGDRTKDRSDEDA